MNKYNVIWFDDEHETRKKIRERAHLSGITLKGFSNAKEGIEELRNNIKAYDAAILDGIFYLNPNEKGTPTEDDALGEVAHELIRLESQKKLPWFILSGQSTFTKEKNRFADWYKKGRVFDKFNDEDYDLLWASIKNEADKYLDTRVRQKYSHIITLCSDNYIGSKHYSRVVKILQDIEQPDLISNSEDLLTPMRKLMEAIFSKLNAIGIIPDEIRNNPGWINGSSLFLGDKHINFSHNEAFIPPIIAENIYRLLVITQDASHNEGNKLGVDEHISKSSNSYLYQSSIFLILDILDWSKRFIDDNSNKEQNLSKWKLKSPSELENEYEGFIEQDVSGNYHCGPYLLNKKYVESNNQIGKRIKVTQSEENGIPNLKETYPYFANKYKTTS